MRYVIYSGHWVNSNFGLIRAKELVKTRLFPVYSGGDYRLMGELSLRGKFFEIPECLFFRRIHPAASGQNLGPNWKTKYITGRSGSPGLPLWHLCLDHLITVFRSDLSISKKLHMVGAVPNRMISGKRELLKELELLCKYYATAGSCEHDSPSLSAYVGHTKTINAPLNPHPGELVQDHSNDGIISILCEIT
jgi:hypothetical protein